MCTQIIITILVILFLPLILLVAPLAQGVFLGVKDWTPLLVERLEDCGVSKHISGPVAYVVMVYAIIPVCLALGLIVATFLLVVGSIPIWFFCWIYLLRLLSYQCGTCCWS